MIKGIWDNPYVQDLGIIDHCIEVLELKDQHRKVKAMKNMTTHQDTIDAVKGTLDGEMMDLFLILEKWAHNRPYLKSERLRKFEEKAVEENNNMV